MYSTRIIPCIIFSFQETKRQRNALIKADLKLIFVPLIFLLLRVWSFVIDIPAFYMSKEIWLHMRTTWTAAILSLLSVSLTLYFVNIATVYLLVKALLLDTTVLLLKSRV